MDISTKLTDLTNDLRSCRQAITEKGGEISANAGFAEVAEKILEIPSGTSIGTVIDDTASLIKQVPVNSVNHCFVKSIGGMTYKCNNLIPFPYYGGMDVGYTGTTGGITYTVNEDRSITLNGTSIGASIAIANYLDLPTDNYYLAANLISGEWVDGVYFNNNLYIEVRKNTPIAKITSDKKLTWISINISSGTTVNNLTFKPMLSAKEALPYEDYFEGLQDTKSTAIKVSGANLIPFPYTIGDAGFTQTKGGITFTVNEDRSFTLKGTAQGTPAFAFSSKLDLPTDVDYYLSGNCIGGEWVSGVIIYNQNYVSATNTTPTVRIPKGKKFAWISVQVPNGTTVDATFKPMLNRGQAVPYTPYHEPTTYPIPEAVQGTGKGIEGASDTIDFEDGKKIIKIGEILLKNMSWTYSSNYGFYSYGIKNEFIGNKILCDGYTTNTWNNVYSGTTDMCIAGNGQAIIISDSRYTDDASFIASLGDKKLIYALAKSTEEPLSVGFGLLPVEGGGSLEIITDNGRAIPNTIIYQTIV